jgi:hypothetical protein
MIISPVLNMGYTNIYELHKYSISIPNGNGTKRTKKKEMENVEE